MKTVIVLGIVGGSILALLLTGCAMTPAAPRVRTVFVEPGWVTGTLTCDGNELPYRDPIAWTCL